MPRPMSMPMPMPIPTPTPLPLQVLLAARLPATRSFATGKSIGSRFDGFVDNGSYCFTSMYVCTILALTTRTIAIVSMALDSLMSVVSRCFVVVVVVSWACNSIQSNPIELNRIESN